MFSIAQFAHADDLGSQSVGKIKVSLIYGTNGDLSKAGANLKPLTAQQAAAMKALKKIKFTHYRLIGEDTQPILRSYMNWAKPLKDSKEILISFQPRGKPTGGSLKIDLELWQRSKKIMKGDLILTKGKPLIIQGPTWRGGKIIILIELISLIENVR